MLLKGWLLKTGTTLDELASLTGLSIPHLSNIQNGKALPSLDKFKVIVDVTELDAKDLLEDTVRLWEKHGKGG